MIRRALLLLSLPAVVAAAPRMEVDQPGSKDHPLFTRMPGFYIERYKEAAFDREEFLLPRTREAVEGRRVEIHYKLRAGEVQPSPLEVVRNHAEALEAHGGEVLYDKTSSGYRMTLRLRRGSAETWIDVLPYGGCTSYRLVIVEKGTMVRKIRSGALMEALDLKGSIALDILFDTGKDTIREESRAQLEEIRALLLAHPGLRLAVEGHTDNTGTPEGNRQLSVDRAEAVVEALVDLGIEEDRLEAKGFGRTRPVADNATEEGRRRNRRVELVKL